MATPEIDYSITTRLLTLLNVSAINVANSSRKRKRDGEGEDLKPKDSRPKKLNARKSSSDSTPTMDLDQEKSSKSLGGQVANDENVNVDGIDETQEPESQYCSYSQRSSCSLRLLIRFLLKQSSTCISYQTV